MRMTTVLSQLLGLKRTGVRGLEWGPEGLIADVVPSTRVPRCSGCERKARRVYDRYEGRLWRHLDLAGMKLQLRYTMRRVRCRRCGVRVEWVPWAMSGSWFTFEFEDHVGYLAQRCDQSTVSTLMRIGWQSVGKIIERVVERHGDADRLDGLSIIGVDELSYRRHHEYVTVVIDHVEARVVWARPGKSAETLKAFFEELGPERCAQLEAVTIDMSKAFIKAITEASPKAKLIFDRFHVQRLAHDALDKVRRDEFRSIEDPKRKKKLKKTRWALQKNPWNLTPAEERKLSTVQKTNRRLYRAYLLKEALLGILDRRQVNVAREKLEDWIRWALRSQLQPFRKLARTVRKHLEGILAYVSTGLSNGRTEALNGKARTITRRSYGFHSAYGLIAMLFLCCGNIRLWPVHRYPQNHPLNL